MTKTLNIKIDEIPEDITLNQLYTLFQKEQEDSEKKINYFELEELQVLKYIKIIDYDTWEWEFRQKGLDLLETGIIFYENKGIGSKNPNQGEFISKYRKLFKETGMSGRTADIRTTTKKMEWFQKEYPEYSEDIILKATAKYIQQEAHSGFKYLQRCDYFISKEDTSKIKVSRLASFCEEIEDNYEEEANYGTFNKFL